jgi:hypothetical protein
MLSSPFNKPVGRAATLASLLVASVAFGAGAVRLLPWCLDPAVPWRVLVPFARGVGVLALEAAMLLGWPLGVALALQVRVERGEWRGLEALGERPIVAAARLLPSLLAPAVILVLASFLSARDASDPGRVANELLEGGRVACAATDDTKALRVPIVDATWLCVPGRTPRLLARAPGPLGGLLVTAERVRVAGDFRGLELEDVRTTLRAQHVKLHVGRLSLRGLAPWTRASSFPAWERALLLVVSLAASVLGAALAALRGAVTGRVTGTIVGASGPVATLLLMRALERADAAPFAYMALPAAAALAVLVASASVSRLPANRRAATSK